MAKTQEELQADIKALQDAGMDATAEEAELKKLVLAGAKPTPTKATAVPATSVGDEDFIPLNTESYSSGGGGWVAPAATGVLDAVCEGYMVPDFVDDQLWFIFKNPEFPEGDNPFRGALVCGAISKPAGSSGAWKVKDVAIALGIDNLVKVEEGKGIKGLKACEGKACQILWDDIPIKGKTERRIQDCLAPGAEPVI